MHEHNRTFHYFVHFVKSKAFANGKLLTVHIIICSFRPNFEATTFLALYTANVHSAFSVSFSILIPILFHNKITFAHFDDEKLTYSKTFPD